MSRQLSPFAIVEITESLGRQRMNTCKEWNHLWQRYVIGEPSHLPMDSLKNTDSYALALGRMTKSDAIRMVFSSGGPVTLYGTMPTWLIPAVVEVSVRKWVFRSNREHVSIPENPWLGFCLR